MLRVTDLIHGRVRLGVAGLTIAALTTGLVWTAATAGAQDIDQHADHGQHGRTFVPRTADQVAFHDQMRKLWEDHITWTRLAIIAAVDELPDTQLTVERLLRNQDDIGAAIAPFYGEAAADQLTVLLREHITVAVELVLAAKSGDSAAFDDAKERWYANGDEIADFLAAANPRFWPTDVMRDAMRTHLDQTLAEAAQRIAGDHAAEIATYEEVHAHILVMADLLSAGIMQQFPSQF